MTVASLLNTIKLKWYNMCMVKSHEEEISDNLLQGYTKSNKPLVDSGDPICHHQPTICCRWVHQVEISKMYLPIFNPIENMLNIDYSKISFFYCYRQKILGGDGGSCRNSILCRTAQVLFLVQDCIHGHEFSACMPRSYLTACMHGHE